MTIFYRLLIAQILLLLTIPFFTASPTDPVSEKTINESSIFLTHDWNRLPFKHQRADNNWIRTYVNPNFDPKGINWDDNGNNLSMKCLSYGAATVADYLSLQQGAPLRSYINVLNNRTEYGHNPRELEQIYINRTRSEPFNHKYTFFLDGAIKDAFVTLESIPYDTKGYADIIVNPPDSWFNRGDTELNHPSYFNYTVDPDEYFPTYQPVSIGVKEHEIELALQRYGVLYAHLDVADYFGVFPIHAVAIFGYGNISSQRVFWIHDSYDFEYPDSDSRYKSITADNLNKNELWAFVDTEWPFLSHDLRRTSATTTKGDILFSTNISTFTYNLQSGVTESEETSRIGIGNLERENTLKSGENEVVVTTDNGFGSTGGSVHTLHFDNAGEHYSMNWQWSFPQSYVGGAPSIENFDSSDTNKEIIFGLRNGSLYALDGPTNSQIWSCSVPMRYSNFSASNSRGRVSNFAISDIDLDGTKEIIFTDSESPGLYDWPGNLYVFSERGNTTMNDCGSKFKLEANASLGNPGSFDPPSIADVDGDDYSEIIVPAHYNISVWDYNGSVLSMRWSNATGLIQGTVAVYDINKDDQYEVIYVTTTATCAPTKNATCSNTLWVRNAASGALKWSKTLSVYSEVGPAIADLDYDGDYEIVITGHNAVSGDAGKVLAFDGDDGTQEWSFDDGGTLGINYVGVSLADIDGDGKYNVIFPNNESKLYILRENGSILLTKSFSGQIGSAPAVGMISRKGVAEIAVKHAGSPITDVTFLTGTNRRPVMGTMSNRTVYIDALFNINATGEVLAADADNDSLSFYYGSPLNSTGLWQPTINDTGTYEVLVEVTDGNLSDWQYVTLRVVEQNLSVDSFEQVYTNNRSKVVEGVITNNFNGTASKVAWAANLNETTLTSQSNASLAVDEQMTVLLEYNYSSSGWKNVSLRAYDGARGLNDTFNNSIFIGPLRVTNLSATLNGTQAILTFIIYTVEENALSGINWSLNTNQSMARASSLLNLSAYGSQQINVSYNYSDSGNYTATVLVWNNMNNDSMTLVIEIPDILIDQFTQLHDQDNTSVITFSLTNELTTTMNQVSWKFDSGEENITAQTNISLSPSEVTTVIIEKNYSNYGIFVTKANATDGIHTKQKTLSIELVEITIQNFQKLYSNSTRGVFEFNPNDEFSTNKSATWSFNTNDTAGVVWAATPLTLPPDENVSVIIEHNFSSTGLRSVVASANTSRATYSSYLNATVS
jgi:hypothetical protein